MLVLFKCAVEGFSQAVTFEYRRNFKFGLVVPCANKKEGRLKKAGFTGKMICFVSEIGIQLFSLFPVATKRILGENQHHKFEPAFSGSESSWCFGCLNRSITKRINPRTACAGQFVSRSFVVLLRKSIPQNHNLQTAVVRGVRLNQD